MTREYKTLKSITNFIHEGELILKEGNVYESMRRTFVVGGELVPVLRFKAENGMRVIVEDKTDEGLSLIKLNQHLVII